MNERWYSVTAEDTAKQLNTSVSLGLSEEEAKARLAKFGENTVYKARRTPIGIQLAAASSDVSVALFAVVLVISAFFESSRASVTALCLLFAAFVVSLVCHLRSNKIFEDAEEYSVPTVCVLRGGKVYVIDPKNIVMGDVILLDKGDVVPCDCRLISSDDLRAIEFVGKANGKEKKELTLKEASKIYRADDKLRISEQQNMVSTAAVIASGHGRAIAVRTGDYTFLSAMLGKLDPITPRGRKLTFSDNLRRYFLRLGLVLLIAVLPVCVMALIFGKNEFGVFGIILTFLALAATSGSELLASLISVFPSGVVKKAAESDNCSCVKFRSAVGEMNYVDSVILLGKRSVETTEKKIESVYAANRFYDITKTKENSEDPMLVCFSELAYLGTSYGRNSLSCGGTSDGIKAAVIERFATDNGIDTEKLRAENEIVEFSPASVSTYDTTLVKNGEEYRVICISHLPSLIGLCTDIRMPSGLVPLGEAKRSELIRTCEQFAKHSKQVTLVASRISPCSSLARLGAVQNQLVFEGFFIYADPYPEKCAVRIQEMKNADIAVYYFDKENPSSIITAFNTGIVKARKEIAYASSFRRSGKKITDDIGTYRAYLGFTQREYIMLTKAIRGENGTVAVIASETDHLSVMNEANFSAVLSEYDDKGKPKDSLTSRSEIIKKNADILLPHPMKSGKGIESFFEAVMLSKNACAGLAKILRYMMFALALRLVVSVPPLLVGYKTLTPIQILILGVLIDIPAMLYFSHLRGISSLSDRLEDVENITALPVKYCLKYCIGGAALGLIILLMTLVLGSSKIAAPEMLSTFAFGASLLAQLFALLIAARFKEDDKKGKTAFALHAVIVIALLVLAVAFPAVGVCLDVTYPGWQICAAAPIVAVIGYVMFFVTDRYI